MALSDRYPPYCCIILVDSLPNEPPRFLLEARGDDANVAPNKLTCFGGKREQNESPVDCILRECREELGSNW